MLGRAVFVLCLLSGAAYACPDTSPPNEAAIAEMSERMRADHSAAALWSDDSQGLLVAFAFMGLCAFGFFVTRSNAVRRTFATSRRLAEIELDVLKRVAQIQRNRAAMFAATCTVAIWATTHLPLVPIALMWAVTSELILLAFAMIAMCRLQLLIGLHHEPELRAFSHGHYLYAARDNRLVDWVGASPRLLARASALPMASVRRA